MAFCTSCGAQVKGAFCEQCGTPVSAAGGAGAAAGAPPAMSPPAMSPAAAPPVQGAVAAKKTNPLVIILLVVVGLIVISFVGCVVMVGYFARNPGAIIAKAITASNPDLEVVNTDMGAQKVTIRDKKTGEEMTMSFNDVKEGKIKMRAVGRNGEVANVEIGGGAGKVPSWVPTYPGARAQGNFTATADDGSGRGAGGVVTFESSDAPDKVVEFYKDKVNSMGMKVVSTFNANDAGMMMAQDESEKRWMQVTVGKGSGGGSAIGVTFGEKK